MKQKYNTALLHQILKILAQEPKIFMALNDHNENNVNYYREPF